MVLTLLIQVCYTSMIHQKNQINMQLHSYLTDSVCVSTNAMSQQVVKARLHSFASKQKQVLCSFAIKLLNSYRFLLTRASLWLEHVWQTLIGTCLTNFDWNMFENKPIKQMVSTCGLTLIFVWLHYVWSQNNKLYRSCMSNKANFVLGTQRYCPASAKHELPEWA